MRLETAREVVLVGTSTPAEASREIVSARNTQSAKIKKTTRSARTENAHQKKAKSLDQKVIRPRPSKYNNFANLTRSREDVFLATERTVI